MKRIFIVEDDVNISSIIAFNLKAEGFDAVCEGDGERALLRLKSESFDLVLLDIMLPSKTGFEVLEDLRKFSNLPVIILSARTSEDDKLLGLSLMADDYVTKPFSIKELIARIKVNLARAGRSDNATITVCDITVNESTLTVTKSGATVAVSKKEAEILLLLFKNRGSALSREQILKSVWGYDGYLGDTHTVDVAIGRLRAKIEDTPSEPKIILSRRGVGYYVI